MKIYSALLLLFMSSFVWAQSTVVEGKITGSAQPVPFANVGVKGTSIGASSNEQGYYKIQNLPDGELEIIVSSIGFEKARKKIKVENGKTLRVDFELTPMATELNPVVISGTMKENFVSASPVKVEVISAQFLQKNPTNNVMEALQTINGVQEQIACGVCGTSDIHINGMEGPYTLVLIDGMPIMSALASVYGLNGIATSIIDRIEIIKGPSSTLYGTEAVGGLINIITKRAENMPRIFINSFATSHQEFNTDLAYTFRTKKADAMFSLNHYYNQSFRDDNADNFSDVPLNNRISFFNKWNIHRKSNKPFMLSAKYYYEDRFGGTSEWSKSHRGSDSIYGESIYTNRVELISTYLLPLKEDIRWDISYNVHQQNSYYGNTLYNAEQQVFFSNLIWNKKIGARNDLVSGFTFRHQFYDDNSPATAKSEHIYIPGIFLQNEYTLHEKWSMLAGTRFDYHNYHGGIFSPRLNIKYKPALYTTMRLNLGTGFRTVNLFTEEHAALTGARTVVIKNKLKPEESYNLNFNLNHIFNIGETSCTFDGDIFYTYFRNKVLPDYDTDPRLIIYDNLNGNAVSKGISLAFNQQFKFPLSYSIGTTFMDVYLNEPDTNNSLVKSPQLFAPGVSAVYTISYKFRKINTSIDITGRVTGPMHLPEFPDPFTRPVKSDWFNLSNIQVSKVFSKKMELYAGVKNIFNYTQPSPLIDPQNPYGPNFDTAYAYGPLQGRRYLVGLRLKFS
jgi:outer membrane receptor for ferrienterochelin and colicins